MAKPLNLLALLLLLACGGAPVGLPAQMLQPSEAAMRAQAPAPQQPADATAAVIRGWLRKLVGNLRLSSSAEVGKEVSVTVSFQSINQPANRQHHVVPWIGV